MKKITLLCAGLIMLACQQEDQDVTNAENTVNTTQDVLSITEINEYISDQLRTKGDIDWKNNAKVLYSAAMHGGNMLTVGYGEKGVSFSEGAKKSAAMVSAKKEIIKNVETYRTSAGEEVLIDDDSVLNVIDIRVNSLAIVNALVDDKNVRYVEPNGYNHYRPKPNFGAKSGSGCDRNSHKLNNADYKRIAPAALQPWNFEIHNIDKAWQISTGVGTTIGLIDTGLSQNQSKLGSSFNTGRSSGRTVERLGVFIDAPFFGGRRVVDGADDKCGHGTSMAAVIASPRNNSDLPVGVAYNSNLVSYRAVEDVLINDFYEKKGVSDALVALANRSDVKIISMSLGSLFSIGNVKDAIRYAYSKGKLIFVAGGTSTAFTTFVGVTFPASMDEAVAVTGVTDRDKGYKKCGNCHSGKQIEFTIAMQREEDRGRTVPILAFNDGQSRYIGGSSVATAMTAGIAALVWSKNPTWNRDQVLNKMRRSSEFYPDKDRQFGYGNIDALKAVQ